MEETMTDIVTTKKSKKKEKTEQSSSPTKDLKAINKIAEENDTFRHKPFTDDNHKVIINDALSASGMYSAAVAITRTFHKFDSQDQTRESAKISVLDRPGFFKIEYFSIDDWSVPGDPLKGPVKRKLTIGLGEL